MRVFGKPLTETAPGRLEWLRWVGPLRSSCLLRLNKAYKHETVTTTSTTTEGNNISSIVSLWEIKCLHGTHYFRFPFSALFVPSLLYLSLLSPSYSVTFAFLTQAIKGGNSKIIIVTGSTISCISHWSAHKQRTAIDPLVFLINGLSVWETTGFTLPIRTFW